MKIVCGGMYRSGSTWQFNAIRILLCHAGKNPVCGVDDENHSILNNNDCCVIKSHVWSAKYSTCDFIFTSHRDLRDVVASCHRKFKKSLSLDTADEAYSNYIPWTRYANYDMKYENMITDKTKEIKTLSLIMKLSVDAMPIVHELEVTKYKKIQQDAEYDPVSLMHHGHITDGRFGSWPGLIPSLVVYKIEQKYHDWMSSEMYI